MKRLLSIVVFVAVASLSITGQDAPRKADAGSTEEAVLKLTNEWLAAEAKQDGPTLDRIVAEDFLGTTPGGDVITKKMLIPDPKAKGGGLALTPNELKARVFGEMAVVTGRGTSQGQVTGEFRFTVVFVKRQDVWQMVGVHLSNVTHKPK
jgi:hypothetical protein